MVWVEDNHCLLVVPSMEELREDTCSIPSSRSPRPDGFGSGFYIACWLIIKEDLLEAMSEFFRGGPLP